MSDDEDIEPGSSRADTPAVPASLTQKRRSFEFLDADDYKGAKSALVERKFLKDHVERLEDEVSELKPYREQYYETKTKLDVISQRRGLTRTAAGVSSVMLAVGGVGLGISKDLSDMELSLAILIGLCSLLLIFCSFLMRVRDA